MALISDAVARLGYEYDRSGLQAAIKDQDRFAEASKRGEKAMTGAAKEAAQYETALKDIKSGAKQASDGIGQAEAQSAGLGKSLGDLSQKSGAVSERLASIGKGSPLGDLADRFGDLGERAGQAQSLVSSLSGGFQGLAGSGGGALGGLTGGFQGLVAAINPATLAIGALALAGLAAGVAVAKGIGAAVSAAGDLHEAQNQARAQFGATETEAARLGAVGVEVWKHNWGESITEATVRAGTLQQVLGHLGDTALAEVTQASLAFEQVFGKGVEDQNRGMQSLINNFGDLEGSGTAALDLLTAGFQKGLNSQDDLLDTANEYSGFFSQMGFSAEEFFGILEQGLDAGAKDTDKVADAFKEFQIRVMDGSDSTRTALENIGLDTALGAQMARGEVSFKDGFGQIQSALMSMDEDLREQAGVALFGTQWEDTMRGIIGNIDLATAGLDVLEGATLAAGAAANNNLGAAWETVKRGALANLLPLVQPFVDAVRGPAIEAVQGLGDRLSAMADSDGFAVLVASAQGLGQALGFVLGLLVDVGGLVLDVSTLPAKAFDAGVGAVRGFAESLGLVRAESESMESVDARLAQSASNMSARFGEAAGQVQQAFSFGDLTAGALTAVDELGRGFNGLVSASGGLAASEEEHAERMGEAHEELRERVGAAMSDLWAMRRDFDAQFQEARAKDLAAQRNAQGQIEAGQAAHAEKMAGLQEKLAGAEGGERAKIEASIAEEQRRWDGILSVAQGGTTAAVAEVQARYDEERAAIRESLAQTVIDHTNSMVLMGTVSADTAKGVYQALASAYPDVDVINPATEATLEFNATLNEVLAGDKDPEAIVSAIDHVETSMLEMDERNRESLGLAQEAWEGHGIAAAAGGDAIAGSFSGIEAASKAASSTIGDEAKKSAGAVDQMGTGIQAGVDHASSAMAQAGEQASRAGSTIRGSFAGVGQGIARDGQAAALALDDMTASGGAAARSIDELQAAAASAGTISAGALEGGAKAAKDAASDMEDTASSVSGLGEAVEELPDEIVFEGDDALRLLRDLDRMLDDLRANADQGFVIRGRYVGKGPASASSPFALFGMIEDVRDLASEGFALAGSFVDRSGGLLGATTASGELPIERMLRRLADEDYEIVIRASLDAGELIAGINAAVVDARTLFEALMGAHAAFMRGGAAEEGSLASILAGDGEVPAIEGLPESMSELMGFLDSLPSMAHLLANPEARAEIEAMIEEQMRLWGRFIEDLEAAEDARHQARMDGLKAEGERGEEEADKALDRINRLLEIRRSGTGPAGDKPIELEDFSDEVDRVARLFADLGVIANGTKSDLEAFYSEMTGGVNTSINSSEALLDVIELMKESWAEGVDDQIEAEEDRHEAAKANIEGQDELIQRLLEDWELGIERVGDAEAALAAARKEFLDELKVERKAADDLEKAVHDELMDRLDELEEREEEAHEARMARLDEREEAEVARAEAEIAREREHLDSLEAGLRELERQKVDRELAEIGDGISIGLAEAESALDGLNKALSEFDKRAEIRERARRRPGSRGMGKVALDENARAGLQAALDSGELSETAARRARLALSGASLGSEQMRQLYEEAGLALDDTLDARRDELALLDEQIARQQLLIDQETFRFEDAAAAIDANHQARMDAIQAQRDAEEAAWEAYQGRLDDARRAEDDRHEAKMAQIEREFRARLLAEGFIDEAGRDPDEIAREIAEIADRIFGPLRDFVRGTESEAERVGGTIGGAARPPGGAAPGFPGIGRGVVPGPIAPGEPDLPPPSPPAPPERPPELPPGGVLPGLPLPELPAGAIGAFEAPPTAAILSALTAFSVASASALTIPSGSVADTARGAAMVIEQQAMHWNQYGDINRIDASDAPDEFIDFITGLVGLRRAP